MLLIYPARSASRLASLLRSVGMGRPTGSRVPCGRRSPGVSGFEHAEALEPRQLLAIIAWDGGPTGNGTDLNLAANWVGDVLPGSGDDATIAATGTNPLITLSAERTFNSVTSSRPLQINSGGNLTTAGTSALTATLTLSGGTLTGGTWGFSGAGNQINGSSSGGTLANVAVNGEIVLGTTSVSVTVAGTTTFTAARLTASGASLLLATGYTLNSPVMAEGPATGARSVFFAWSGIGTNTIGPSGSIRLMSGTGGGLRLQSLSTATVVNNGLISAEASFQTLTVSVSTLTNNAAIQATSGTFILQSATWTNAGSISASGATVTFGGAWVNTGTVSINAATLNLGGSFTTAGLNLPGLTRTGGTVNLTGTLTNTDSTLTLGASTGSWNLLSGTIKGGSLAFTGGSALVYTSSGGTLSGMALPGGLALSFGSVTLDSVTVNGDVVLMQNAIVALSGTTSFGTARLQGSVRLDLSPGYTLNNPVLAEGAFTGTRIVQLARNTAGTATVGPSGSIRLMAGSGGGLSIDRNFPATLVNNGLISAEAAGQTLTVAIGTLANSGTVQVLGGTLTVGPNTTVTNSGTVQIIGGTLTLSPFTTYINPGTFAVNDGTLNIDGAFNTTGGIGTWSSSGGTVNVRGAITNTGSTLTLDASTGSWNLLGGTVEGGTLAFADGSTLNCTPSGATFRNLVLQSWVTIATSYTIVTLDSVTVNADVVLSVSNTTVRLAGTTTFTTARLRGGVTLEFDPGYTLNSPVVGEGATVSPRRISLATFGGPATNTIGPSGSIRLLPGATGTLTIESGFSATLVNNGLIAAEAAGLLERINIAVSTLTNNGTLRVSAGTLGINGGTVLTNLGTISVGGGTLKLGGTFNATGGIGTWSRTGGTVDLGGTLTNTGSTLTLNASTGSWNLQGGTINGGSLAFADGSTLSYTTSGGTLSSVTINGDVMLSESGARVGVRGTTTFTTARLRGDVELQLDPGYTLNSPVVAEGAATGARTVRLALSTAGTVTVGPSGSIRLLAGSGGALYISESQPATLVNNGLISAEAAGQTLTISPSTFTNNGTVQVSTGTLSVFANYKSSGHTAVSGGTLDFFQTFNTAGGIGSWSRTGGNVNMYATIANAGWTLRLDASTGSWNFLNGTINGGALAFAGGSTLNYTSEGGRLNNVAVDGDLVLSATNARLVLSGTTSFATARLRGQVSLRLNAGYTLNSPVVAEGPAAGTRQVLVAMDQTGTNTIGPSGSIRLLPGSGGGLSIDRNSSATLVNNGLISAEAAGQTLTLGTPSALFALTNNGTVQVAAGTLTVVASTLTNVSSGTLTGGTWRAIGGTLTTSAGTITTLATGTTVELGATGAWAAVGTLTTNAGTLRLSGGRSFTTAAGLANDGTLDLSAGSVLDVVGSFSQASGASLVTTLAGPNAVTDFGRVAATGTVSLAGTLTAAYQSGYTPTATNTRFNVVTGSSVSGVFQTVNVPAQPVNRKLVAVYNSTAVQLLFTSQADFNNDGALTPSDIFNFLNAYSNPATPLIQIDFDNNGVRSSSDIFTFLNIYFAG